MHASASQLLATPVTLLRVSVTFLSWALIILLFTSFCACLRPFVMELANIGISADLSIGLRVSVCRPSASGVLAGI